jgi:murein DD-endopeptidase MepM/ murein hydrolase activator NlpD
MTTRLRRFVKVHLVLSALLILFAHSNIALAIDEGTQDFYSSNSILVFDEDAGACASGPGGGGGAATGQPLPTAVPEPWRTLIESTAGTYPTADRRLVAATLWAENRGWPVYKTSGWGVSEAAAAGPWQFIPSTWASMGTDGDGDGRKDPDNPRDAVHAAFKHQLGSTGLPILYQATGNADVDFNSKPFYRNDTSKDSLMRFMAKYNGSGAPDGRLLKDFPRGQNSDYVRMGFWLIATNFEKGWHPEKGAGGEFVDAKTTGALFGANNGGGESTPGVGAASCAAGGFGSVNSEGYSFPLVGPKAEIKNGYSWPCPNICHHDGSAAFDLTHKPDDSSEGLAVYAIRDGTIGAMTNMYAGVQGCNAFQLEASDGYKYWYGHLSKATVTPNKQVKAGEQIAQIGRRACTGNGSYPHLHIDRGFPKGHVGGIDSSRDKDFIPLMNKLYEELK